MKDKSWKLYIFINSNFFCNFLQNFKKIYVFHLYEMSRRFIHISFINECVSLEQWAHQVLILQGPLLHHNHFQLGVLFSGPICTMHPTMWAHIAKGYAALARLERQCFHSHFHDPCTKSLLVDSLIQPTRMYGGLCWGPNLSCTD